MSTSESAGHPYHVTLAGTTRETLAWVALGANLGPREQTLQRACRLLNALPEVRVQVCSSFYQTPAWGPPAPDYLNAAVRVATHLGPLQLLEALLRVERSFGRARHPQTPSLSPRPLDLDLLLYGDEGECELSLPLLQLPHPRLHERLFVLEPLAELDPDLLHPRLKRSIASLRAQAQAESAL